MDQDQPKKRTRKAPRRKDKAGATKDEVKVTLLAPKHPGAKPENKDDCNEVGPDAPPPQAWLNKLTEVTGRLVGDFLIRHKLPIELFDDETWGPFVRAVFGFSFCPETHKDELLKVLERALEKKQEELRQQKQPRKKKDGARGENAGGDVEHAPRPENNRARNPEV